MPRDRRLWMSFPIDFWQHPKIAPLSDGAFRAFVELNGYSRMQDLDGRIRVAVVKRMWPASAIAELIKNHPERPSLSIEDDEYVIWNYGEHQETRASREERKARNTANGSKGGRPPKKNPQETDSVSGGFELGTGTEPSGKQSQSQSPELDQDTHISGHLGDRVGGTDDGIEKARAAVLAGVGIKDVTKVRTAIAAATDRQVTGEVLQRVVLHLLDKASGTVKNPQAYVLKCIYDSWAEVQQFIDEEAL